MRTSMMGIGCPILLVRLRGARTLIPRLSSCLPALPCLNLCPFLVRLRFPPPSLKRVLSPTGPTWPCTKPCCSHQPPNLRLSHVDIARGPPVHPRIKPSQSVSCLPLPLPLQPVGQCSSLASQLLLACTPRPFR